MPEKEELVRCPYNKYHLILKPRLSAHLCKCRLQYKGTDIVICPFNATHNIFQPELQYHVENCPDRRKLDSYLYVVGDKREKKEVFDVPLPDSTENWDEQPATKFSYLDVKDKIISERPILRLPVAQSRAKRKEFFAAEMKKFENMEQNGSVPSASPNINRSEEKSQLVSTSKVPFKLGMGRGIKVEIEKSAMKSPRSEDHDTDDDDEDEEFRIVLKNRGRGIPCQVP